MHVFCFKQKGYIARINWLYDAHGLRQMDPCNVSYYSTMQLYTHTTLATSKTTLAIDPCTGRASTASVLQAKNKKRPTKWVGPPSQNGKDERRIGWKNKNWLKFVGTDGEGYQI